jgi:hypothetical protein
MESQSHRPFRPSSRKTTAHNQSGLLLPFLCNIKGTVSQVVSVLLLQYIDVFLHFLFSYSVMVADYSK